MDYISREDWYELSKWLDISQGFYEAYTRFRIEGQEVHWLKFNERNIEVGFFYDDENSDWINVKLYCPDVEVEFNERFLLNENAYSNEKRITKEIIAKIYRLAWSSFYPEVFKVTTGDSEKAYKQIEKILIEKDCLCHDAYWAMEADDVECIIKLYGRKILVHLQVNDCDESCTDFWLECLDTDRSLLQVVGYGNGTMEDIIQRIQYLALEPECFKIITTDYEWEYELIRAIVDNAIHVCPYACSSGKSMEERTIELHGRQIKMQFRIKDKVQAMPKERDYYISVHLDCITTGRSISCAVEAFDENPQELIWKIQEIAWEAI